MNARKIDGVEYSTHYLRSFEKLPEPIKKKARMREKMFLENAFHPQLKTHKLHGKLHDYWAYSIDRTYRVIFRFTEEQAVIYHDIGDHSLYE